MGRSPSLRNCAARAQAVDFVRIETELAENLLAVLSETRSAPRRHFRDTVHLDRTADCRRQLAACAVERDDDVVRPQLRIVDHLLRPANGAKRNVDAAEHLVPVRHWL